MIEFTLQTALGLIRLLLLVFAIIMPLMIALELFRYYGLLARIARLLEPITRRIGFGHDSVYPLLAGIVFGISYGGGVLIGEANKGRVVKDQAFLVAVFLAICHALVEDTFLFVLQGANGWIVILTRFILAIMVTAITATMIKRGWS